ncbi:MAG: hypothetical protein NC332_01115 [Firmicutes bacterium]|nr:hypothetical protein [Bacillota bacterium]
MQSKRKINVAGIAGFSVAALCLLSHTVVEHYKPTKHILRALVPFRCSNVHTVRFLNTMMPIAYNLHPVGTQ